MVKKPEHKQKNQYGNKFSKDFKNGPHPKENLKKKGLADYKLKNSTISIKF